MAGEGASHSIKCRYRRRPAQPSAPTGAAGSGYGTPAANPQALSSAIGSYGTHGTIGIVAVATPFTRHIHLPFAPSHWTLKFLPSGQFWETPHDAPCWGGGIGVTWQLVGVPPPSGADGHGPHANIPLAEHAHSMHPPP